MKKITTNLKIELRSIKKQSKDIIGRKITRKMHGSKALYSGVLYIDNIRIKRVSIYADNLPTAKRKLKRMFKKPGVTKQVY